MEAFFQVFEYFHKEKSRAVVQAFCLRVPSPWSSVLYTFCVYNTLGFMTYPSAIHNHNPKCRYQVIIKTETHFSAKLWNSAGALEKRRRLKLFLSGSCQVTPHECVMWTGLQSELPTHWRSRPRPFSIGRRHVDGMSGKSKACRNKTPIEGYVRH